MKVLYIGHYREGTGWSQAAVDYILALDKAGVDVVCRPVKLNYKDGQVPGRILELESKDSKGSTHCIQHVLPHYMDYNGHFEKNVGMLITETDSIFATGWPQRLKTMDEVWVPNLQAHRVALDAGVKNVRLVPHPANINKYLDTEISPADFEEFRDCFMFYTIGENNRRKRLSATLQAYFTSFTCHDDVVLAIKTNGDSEAVHHMAQMIRDQLRMYPNQNMYPRVVFITEHLPEDDIIALHKRGDCFVNTSHGEAWSIPTFDAMGFGNWVISSDTGGMADFLRDYDKGLLISGNMTPVIGADRLFDDVQTGHENWFNIDICEVQKAMKLLYFMSLAATQKGPVPSSSNPRENYSYENVGQLMKGYLNVENVD